MINRLREMIFGPSRPVVLVTLYDGFINYTVRSLYGQLRAAGFPCKVIRFGRIQPFERNLDLSLFQSTTLKFPLVNAEITEAEALEFRKVLAELNPLWLGFTISSPQGFIAERLTREARSTLKCPIIWGGAFCMAEPERSIRHADAVCIGEGDEIVLEVSKALRRGEGIPRVEGLWVRQADGSIFKGKPRSSLREDQLNRLPITLLEKTGDEITVPGDLHDVLSTRWEEVDGALLSSAHNVYNVGFSRGCYFACSFCWRSRDVIERKGLGKSYRVVSPENAVRQCELALKTGARRITVWDEVFPTDVDWLREFSAKYRQRVGLPFVAQVNPKITSDEAMALIIEAGLDCAILGLQSASARVRREVFNKRETNDDFRSFAERWKDRVLIAYELIYDNPFETLEDLKEGIEFLLSLPRPYVFDVYTMMFLPGHQLTRQALAAGYITEEQVTGAVEQPGSLDLVSCPVIPRTDIARRSLTILLVAAAEGRMDAAEVRRLAQDPASLEDDTEVSLKVLQALHREERRLMYEEESLLMDAYRAAEAVAQ